MISAQDFLHRQSEHFSTQTDNFDTEDTRTYVSAPVKDETSGVFRRGEEENKCQEAALRLLDAAPRPSGALHDRLCAKGFDETIVEKVIARLIRISLIDDESYARSAVRYCISRKMGENGTFQELKRKGVDSYTARTVVDEAQRSGLFVQSAYALVDYVAQRTQGLDRHVRLRRLWSAAGRKGHNPDLIRQAQYEIFAVENDQD